MKFFKAFAVVFFLITIKPHSAEAGHAMIYEMFYRHVQDSTYEFTLVFYKNCLGASIPPPTSVSISAKSASAPTASINLLNMISVGPGVPPLLPPGIMNCTNNPFCVEEIVYRGNWTSPKRVSDWLFSYELCCLPTTGAPANLANNSLYIECSLNNLNFPDKKNKNHSPVFHNRRPSHVGFLSDTVLNYSLVSVCEGRDVVLNEGARNYDGDRIKYEFFAPQTTGGAQLPYINGFTFSNPIPAQGLPIQIDSTTGEVVFKAGTPTGTGNYLIGIKATEFRNDTTFTGPTTFTIVERKIGFVKRNLFITIEDSTTCKDNIFALTDSINVTTPKFSIPISCKNNPIEMGFTFNVKCSSIDTTGGDIVLVNLATMNAVVVTGAEPSSCNGLGHTQRFRFFTSTPLVNGNYSMTFKKGLDGNTILTECDMERKVLEDTMILNVLYQGSQGVILADTLLYNKDTAKLECGADVFDVLVTSPFTCSSAHSIGSDFHLYLKNGTNLTRLPVKSSTVVGCSGGYANKVRIRLDSGLSPGIYLLALTKGTDGNSLLDECYFDMDSSSIIVDVQEFNISLGPDTTVCFGDTFAKVLNAGVHSKYFWNNGTTKQTLTVTVPGTYWMGAWNEFDCLSVDTIRVIGKNCSTGIDEFNQLAIKVFPNPTTGKVNIEYPEDQDGLDIQVFDQMGKKVIDRKLQSQSSHVEIQMNEFESGLYFIQITSEDRVIYREKLIYRGN